MSLIWPVYQLGVIDSTNTEAQRRAKAGRFDDCWLVAEAQTDGRGRLRRQWVSAPGNLYSTALFHEPGGIAIASRIPFAAALAVADVTALLAPGSKARLKWPNDVRIEGAKISGILVETGGGGDTFWVAVGIGINVAEAPEGAGQAATCLNALRNDAALTSGDVLIALKEAFAYRLVEARQGFETLRKDWLQIAEGLGESIAVACPDGMIEGVFEDMASDGALILRLPDGQQKMIRTGDVNLIGRG